jgi:hypothetical protein
LTGKPTGKNIYRFYGLPVHFRHVTIVRHVRPVSLEHPARGVLPLAVPHNLGVKTLGNG